MEDPLTFETQKTPEGMRYTCSQVTLDDVPDGNAVVLISIEGQSEEHFAPTLLVNFF